MVYENSFAVCQYFKNCFELKISNVRCIGLAYIYELPISKRGKYYGFNL